MANPAIERREQDGPHLETSAGRITLRFGAHPARDWTFVEDGPLPDSGALIVPLARLDEAAQKNGLAALGVRIMPGEDVRALTAFLPRIGVVELAFPRYRDGRNYSSARILRDQLGYRGEIRAIGDVLADQIFFMTRCGIDTLELHPSVQAETAQRALQRYQFVYQAASDQAQAIWQRRA